MEPVQLFPGAFYSLAGGLAELVDALVGHLPPASLRLASPVSALTRLADGCGYVLRLEGGEEIAARAVVLAIPAPRAAPLLEDELPEAARTLASIPFASSATVLLGYRRSDVGHPLDGYGMVIPRTEGLRASACSFLSTKFPGRAPADHVLFRGFLGGTRDPEVLSLADDALVELVRSEMTPVLGLKGQPIVGRAYRWSSATPQMEVGHLARIADLEAAVAAIQGLFLGGAGLRVTGLPDCIAEGTRAGTAASGAAV